MKLLVIDDEQPFLQAIEGCLGKDFEIKAVTNGRDALNLLKEFPADCILVDWRLKGMSGREVINWIRKDNKFDFIPIIVLSGCNAESTTNASFQSGADDFLAKPATMNQIAKKIVKLVGEQKFSKDLVKRLQSVPD